MKKSSDWSHWLARWDAQQAGYLPSREDRFNVMLDVLGALMADNFLVVDLACGPGSISQRILARFPGAKCIAVDLDPLLLAMGQGVLGDQQTAVYAGSRRTSRKRIGSRSLGKTRWTPC